MSIELIQQRLQSYQCRSVQEEEHALREITQEVALAALSRTDFNKRAAFQGGTCLRIFYYLNRFSEDLDFILKKADRDFRLDSYLHSLSVEFAAYGYRLEIVDRSKAENAVKKIFIKDNSIGKLLQLRHVKADASARSIRIKIEVDTNPPEGSGFESKFMDFPFVFSVTVQDQPSLFAGKIHALLCREYTKGRDWYDFLWYTGRKTPINYRLLQAALNQTGEWKNQWAVVDKNWCAEQLRKKIRLVNWEEAKADVRRFIRSEEVASIDLWGESLFLDRWERYQNQVGI